MLRPETKSRARALQLLYAWELQGHPPMSTVVDGLLGCGRRRPLVARAAEELADAVAARCEELDEEIAQAAEGWRLARIGVVERNILRLGLYELVREHVPPRVALDEAIRLAHWFAGSKAPAFVNGVLDALARRHERL